MVWPFSSVALEVIALMNARLLLRIVQVCSVLLLGSVLPEMVTGGGSALALPRHRGPAPVALVQTPAVAAARFLLDLTLPASGTQQQVVILPSFGRYRFWTESEQGVALRLLDPIDGPLAYSGAAGVRDGQLEYLLEAGRFRIETRAAPAGSGTVRLRGARLEELQPALPLLADDSLQTADLPELAQRSFSIEIRQTRALELEADGQTLSTMQLFREGDWPLEVTPRCSISATGSTPRTVCRLSTTLPTGRYRLALYGSRPIPWPGGGGDSTVVLRSGVPAYSTPNRIPFVIPRTGELRFRLRPTVSLARVSLNTPGELVVQAAPYEPGVLPSLGPVLRITRENVPAEAEGNLPGSSSGCVLSLSGTPGQAGMLDVLTPVPPMVPIPGEGLFALTTFTAGSPEDLLDSTGLVMRTARRSPGGKVEPPHPEILAEQSLSLTTGGRWTRRFNLSSEGHLLVRIQQSGTYFFRLDKGGQLRIEPFLVSPPRGYVAPALVSGELKLELSAGLHILTLKPGTPGVHRLLMGEASAWPSLSAQPEAPEVQSLPIGEMTFIGLKLEPGYQHQLLRAGSEGVRTGMALVSLPLSQEGSLPLVLRPGENQHVPVQLTRSGRISVEALGGGTIRLSRAEDPAQTPGAEGAVSPAPSSAVPSAAGGSLDLPAGFHVLSLIADSKRTVSALLTLKLETEAGAPLPPAPPLPQMTSGVPHWFDLERGLTYTARLTVPAPGLYRVRSLGELAVIGELRNRGGQLRGRAQGSLRDRAFLLLAFLGAGDYQLQLRGLTEGQQGRVGVVLETARAREGEALHPGLATHHTLSPDEALTQKLTVLASGDYHLRVFGEGRYVRTSLTDASGQALYRSGAYGELTVSLVEGEYQLTVVPEGAPARVTALLEPSGPSPQSEALAREGHGPFTLPPGKTLTHEWREPVAGAERTPDLWSFLVSAPMNVWIMLENGMQGDLERRLTGSDPTQWEKVAWIAPGRPYSGAVEPGQYRIAATSFRPNNRLPYQVTWIPDVLAPGLSRTVPLPASLPIQVAADGQYSLRTLCGRDARARLVSVEAHPSSTSPREPGTAGAQGTFLETTIAEADDGPDDWSPQLSVALKAGRYRLQLDPLSQERTACQVTLDPQKEQLLPERGLPVLETLALDPGTLVLPLVVPPGPELLSILVQSAARLDVSLSLLDSNGTAGRSLGRAEGVKPYLAVALPPSPPGPAHLLLRIKALGTGAGTAQVRIEGLRLPRVPGRALERGLSFNAGSVEKPQISGVLLMADGQGVFQLRPSSQNVLACVRGLEVCRPLTSGLYPAPEERLLLVALPGAGEQRVFGQVRFLGADGGLDGLQLPMETPAHVELRLGGQGVTMVRASSAHGVPGLQLVADLDVPVEITGTSIADTELAGASGGSRESSGGSSAVAVSLSSWPRVAARVWRAEAGEGSFDVDLQAWRFDRDVPRPLRAGRTDVMLRPGSLMTFQLPQGRSSLSLTLASHGVAVLSRGDAVLEVIASAGTPATRMLATEADTLTLLNPERTQAVGLIELDSRNGAFDERRKERITSDAPFERQLVTRGVLGLEVYPPESVDAVLRVEGAVREAVLLDRAGKVSRGKRFTSRAGGRLLLSHDVGPVCVWWEQPGRASSLWGEGNEPPLLDVGLPANLFLETAAQRIRVAPTLTGMLELHVVSPLVVLVKEAGVVRRAEVLDRGGSLEIPVLPRPEANGDSAAGASPPPLELWVRTLGGAGAPGSLRLRFDPVQPWTGKEEAVLLVPGSSRTWWFRTELGGPVGLGVRADREVVEGRLFDSYGHLIQEGSVMMADLPPGAWLLSFRLPASEAPVLAMPRVVGLVRPSDPAPPDLAAAFRQAGVGSAPRISPDASEEVSARPQWDLASDILTFGVPEDPMDQSQGGSDVDPSRAEESDSSEPSGGGSESGEESAPEPTNEPDPGE